MRTRSYRSISLIYTNTRMQRPVVYVNSLANLSVSLPFHMGSDFSLNSQRYKLRATSFNDLFSQ